MRLALLRYVPQRFRTLERCVRMIRLNPNNLLYVPEEHYKNQQFADWVELYWPSADKSNILTLGLDKWQRGLRGVNFIGRGGEIAQARRLLQAPWRDEAVMTVYVNTSQNIADLHPNDLTSDIFDSLIGRGYAADFIDSHLCDKVYQMLVVSSYRHMGSLFKELKKETIEWLFAKGYFTQFPTKAYELPTENIPDDLVLKVLEDITFIQAESVVRHPSFLQLYMQFHGVEPNRHGHEAVNLMYQLLSAYGPYSRPIQAMLIAHSDAMYAIAPIGFTEFVLDALMRMRDHKEHKGLTFHQMVIRLLSDELRYREEVGMQRYMAMVNGDSLNNIRALMQWARWYFRIHHLDEILLNNDKKETWELAKQYATRESLMKHAQGRRLLLEQDMEL